MKNRPMTLWIVRSGETAWDTTDRLYGGEDLPLTDAGRLATTEAVERAATLERRCPRTIFHAPDEAAEDTAQILSSRISAKVREVADLAEPDLGVLAGLSLDELRERFERRARQWESDPSELVPPEGEPFIAARQRISKAVIRILRRSRNDTVAVVLHDFAAGFLRCTLAGHPTGNPRRWMGGRPRIEAWLLPLDALERLQAAQVEQDSK